MEKEKIKLWKKVLIIVLILLAILAIFITRKMIIITKLVNESKEYSNKTNYLATIQSLQNGTVNILKSYNKDGNYLTTVQIYGKDIQSIRGVTTYKNGNENIVTMQSGEDKIAILNGNVLTGEVRVVNILSMIDNAMQKLQLAMISRITTDKCNNKECYIIQIDNWKMWIDKETGLIIREVNETNVTERFYEFDVVKDDNITKPDISNCKIQANN